MTPRLSLPLHVVWLVLVTARAGPAPAPGRVPKVYNALITSNQNLEPSKAYPVYQPVLHDAFAFPYSPVFYGDYPVNNGLFHAPGASPKAQPPAPAPSAPSPETLPAPSESPSEEAKPSPDSPPPATEQKPESDDGSKPTPAPPLPPNTQSPIPLNEFGLPPQVLPLGRIDPAYNGFTQVGPFTYTYPGFRFYDPYDPFGFNPYANLPPLYRPLANSLGPQSPVVLPGRTTAPAAPAVPIAAAAPTPPAEPSDLNLLNYSSKDPAIPNVPPPPLPLGGLKSDKSQ